MEWLIGAMVGLLGLLSLWTMVTVILQDVKIIPALLIERSKNPVIPNGVCGISFPTGDGVIIDVWESAPLQAEGHTAPPLLFNHGNGHTNELFWSYQCRFRDLGFHTYGYDYRGVARSTGWPAERGIETDAAAILTMIAQRHGISTSQVIVMGISLGTGPACYLAEKFNSHRLLLYTPYLSLPELVRTIPGVSFLSRFVWYKFPNRERLIRWFIRPDMPRELILVHGEDDRVIPFSHSEGIVAEIQGHSVSGLSVSGSSVSGSMGAKFIRFISAPIAAHDVVIETTWEEVAKELKNWVRHNESADY